MSHAHIHRHDRRDILSEIDSFLGISNNKKTKTTETQSVVYVTASKTFTGSIGGYVTGSDPGATSTTATDTKTTATTEKTTSSSQTTTEATKTTSTTTASAASTTSSLTSSETTSSQSSLTTTFSTATSASTAGDQITSSTASASPSPTASSSAGLTSGAKAGIAIGVILGLGLIAGLVFFWLHKQRKNRQEAEAAEAAENEKFNAPKPTPSPMADIPPPSMAGYSRSNPSRQSIAPQVSLRPITQFNPHLGQSAEGNPYVAVGAAGAAMTATGAVASLSQIDEAAERPYAGSAHIPPQAETRQDPFTDPVNPFENGSQAGPPPPPSKDLPSSPSPTRDLTHSPTGSSSDIPPVASGSSAEPAEAAAVGAVVGVAGVAGAAVVEKAPEQPAAARTPSPEYVEPTSSRPSSPVVGGAPFSSNVHRVQMDFAPSLADEMELRAGQLVRLLKNYDDGWCQCTSMDGSLKGIAPRTCLSNRPLQPRRPPPGGPNGPGPGPRGPPIMGPNGRPMSPANGGRMGPPPGAPPRYYDSRAMAPGQPSGSMSMPQFPAVPGTPRSMSPGPGRSNADMPRPLTPGGSRPVSPAGGARPRSNSASVGQMGGRPVVQRGGQNQSPLAPPTGPLPGPPAPMPQKQQQPPFNEY